MGNMAFLHGNGGGDASVFIKEYAGSFTTNNSGSATVDCGFKPDVVLISKNATYSNFLLAVGAEFAKSKKTKISSMLWENGSIDACPIELEITQNSTGFSVTAFKYDESWDDSAYRSTFSYIAVKYT
jgi:hypothetical protein